MNPKDILSVYRQDPIKFFTEILDVKREHVWSKMREIAESVRDNQFTAVKAGNSLSKSFTVARVALWYLYTHYPATVVTTAPSNTQVEEIIWREIASAHTQAKVPLGGIPLKTSLDLQKEGTGKKWFATGFATRPDTVTQQATRVQGFHNENVLIIMDEAAGVLPEIWDAVFKLLTNPKQKLIVIGNPTTPRGNFVDCFKDKRFNKITVSVMDSPNYKEGREVIPGLSGREFVQMVIDRYGLNSNYYKAMVTGEIPDEDVDALIPIAWIENAEKNEIDHAAHNIKKFVTWDVADGGEDSHIITSWENKRQIKILELRNKRVEEAEPYVWTELRAIGGNAIVWDNDGVGRVGGGLLEQHKDDNTSLIPFEGSSTAVSEVDLFINRRHESCWQMRKDFENSEIGLLKDNEQREELGSIRLDHEGRHARKGYIAVEPKDKVKEQIGRSPGKADCVMMMAGSYRDIPVCHKNPIRYKIKGVVEDYSFNPMTV